MAQVCSPGRVANDAYRQGSSGRWRESGAARRCAWRPGPKRRSRQSKKDRRRGREVARIRRPAGRLRVWRTAGAAAPRPCRGPPGAVSSTAPACRPPSGRPWPPGRTAWVSRRPRGRSLSPRTVRRPPRPPWRPPGALLRRQLVDRLHGVGRVGDRDVAALDGVVELGGRLPDRLRALDAAQADIELVRRIGLRNSARWRSFPAAGNPAIWRVFRNPEVRPEKPGPWTLFSAGRGRPGQVRRRWRHAARASSGTASDSTRRRTPLLRRPIARFLAWFLIGSRTVGTERPRLSFDNRGRLALFPHPVGQRPPQTGQGPARHGLADQHRRGAETRRGRDDESLQEQL